MTRTWLETTRLGGPLCAGLLAVACTGGGGDPGAAARGTNAPAGGTAIPAPVERAAFSAYRAAPKAKVAPAPTRVTSADRRAVARVSSIDAQRQVPTFIWTPRMAPPASATPLSPAISARHHLRQFAGMYRLAEGDLDNAELATMHDTGRGGIVATFRQKVAGLDVYGQKAKVVMARDQSLIAVSGTLHNTTVRDEAVVRNGFKLLATEAVGRALAELYDIDFATSGASLEPAGADEAGYEHLDLDRDFAVDGHAYRFVTPARVRRVAYAMPDRLRPAYLLEVDAAPRGSSSADMYRYVIAADDGSVLERHNLTAYDSYEYTVFTDDDGRPLDGPIADNATPHPTGNDDGFTPDFVAPRAISVESLNQPGDPWLPPGATETRGNNVDAYADHASPSGYGEGDVRATTTAPGVFGHVFDTAMGPFENQTQIEASVVQLFYINNWLHDYFYDSGFDEAAGNAQEDNFGRGGAGGDVLLAEAQDTKGEQRNNANMSTPGDGRSPRMQMYVFSGDDDTAVEITAPPAIAGAYNAVRGAIGPDDDVVLAGDVVFAVDSDGTATACSDVTNDLTGLIAIVDRGDCPFSQKALAVQAAGATGMIIANNVPSSPISAGGDSAGINIPVVMISQTDGNTIRAESASTISGSVSSVAGPLRDGTIDNHISSHEWGHYIHNRLVSVGSTQARGQGEGWGDFLALMVIVRPGDDLNGAYAMGGYATADAYAGIRRFPYSYDMDTNGLTFKHIGEGESLPGGIPGRNNFEVHNAGEVWATMMFDAFVGLLRESQGESPRYSFEEARRRMTDYVVAGMKAAPSAPTFTEQRDAILAAAAAADLDDFRIIAAAFARRGAGTGAVSPPRNSQDGLGVVESFELKGELSVSGAEVAESADGCDGDGVLDPDETGTIKVLVTNTGAETLTGATATVASATEDVAFPNGTSFDLPALEPFQAHELEVTVSLERYFQGDRFEIEVTASHPDAVETTVVATTKVRANADEAPQSTATETVEARDVASVWTIDSVNNAGPWSQRIDEATGNGVWFVADNDVLSDERLVTPALEVSASEDFVVSFEHRYSFEESPGTLWDGGVLEISTDNGETWADVSQYVEPGYDGVIGEGENQAQNPLGDRPGWAGTSSGYDEGRFDSETLDFGQQLAGQTVRLRFRLGTDQNAGAPGWEIDNLSFAGIDNTPFTEVRPDGRECTVNDAPVADAGPDADVFVGEVVTLDGTGSSDGDNDPLTYQWTQVSGPTVFLDDSTSATPSFTAPVVAAAEAVVFELVVNDRIVNSAPDQVAITINRESSNPADDDAGGCGCHGSDSPAGSGVLLLLTLGLLAVIFRRRVIA